MRRKSLLFVITLLPVCFGQTDHPGSMTVGGGVNPCTLSANGTDSYTCTLPKPILSYRPRVTYVFTPDVNNTGSATLAIDGLGAKSIVRQDGSALSDNDLRGGISYALIYNSDSDNLIGVGVGASSGGGGGGGSGTPGGSSGQLQYNNAGALGGLTGSTVSGSRFTFSGMLDLGTGSGFRQPAGTTLPPTCEVGQTFFKTNEMAGRNAYGCTATNVWTLMGGGTTSGGTGCASGTGVHIPAVGGAQCAKGTATSPHAWAGLDFQNPSSLGTRCINLDSEVPTGWNGNSAPDIQMTYSRPDGTFTAGNKFIISAKTWFVPDGNISGGNGTMSTPVWNGEVLNDISPTGSDVLALDQKYTTTIRSLDLGTSPNQAIPKGTLQIQVCRQATGAGGRTDTLAASIRVTKMIVRWSAGTRVTSTTGTTAAGTTVAVDNVNGVVSGANQKILILGAGTAGANYTGTISSFTGTTLTVSPATTTSVPANTLVAFEASLIDKVFHLTGSGPEAANGAGGLPQGAQIWDDAREWTATNGAACNITGVSLPASASTACVVNTGTRIESGIQFPDNSASTNCVFLRGSTPPNWDNATAPTLFLTWTQVGAGLSNVLMNAATWHIAENSSYTSATYTQTNCTVMAATGDMKKLTITCPDLSITGAGAGRSYEVRICRDGANAADTSTLPIRVYESKIRWTLTSACPAP
jgi:hypothetical protein